MGVVIGKDGQVITKNGCHEVQADPAGVRFPWKYSTRAMLRNDTQSDLASVTSCTLTSQQGQGEADTDFMRLADGACGDYQSPKDGMRQEPSRPQRRNLGWRESNLARVVDDDVFAEKADKVALTEEGYNQVASFQSNYAMKRFTRRLVEAKRWAITDE